MQAAGHVEGFATASRLETHARNIGVASAELAPGVTQFLARNAAYLDAQVADALRRHAPDRAYWWHVQVLLEQQQGLFDGYQQARSGTGAHTGAAQ